MPKNKAVVFAVHTFETQSRFHEVTWAADGDLVKAGRAAGRGVKNTPARGMRRFRQWGKAKAFARQVGKQLGVKPIIDAP